MRRLLLSAFLIAGCSAVLADSTSQLLEADRVQRMTEAEYIAAISASQNINARTENGLGPLH